MTTPATRVFERAVCGDCSAVTPISPATIDRGHDSVVFPVTCHECGVITWWRYDRTGEIGIYDMSDPAINQAIGEIDVEIEVGDLDDT